MFPDLRLVFAAVALAAIVVVKLGSDIVTTGPMVTAGVVDRPEVRRHVFLQPMPNSPDWRTFESLARARRSDELHRLLELPGVMITSYADAGDEVSASSARARRTESAALGSADRRTIVKTGAPARSGHSGALEGARLVHAGAGDAAVSQISVAEIAINAGSTSASLLIAPSRLEQNAGTASAETTASLPPPATDESQAQSARIEIAAAEAGLGAGGDVVIFGLFSRDPENVAVLSQTDDPPVSAVPLPTKRQSVKLREKRRKIARRPGGEPAANPVAPAGFGELSAALH